MCTWIQYILTQWFEDENHTESIILIVTIMTFINILYKKPKRIINDFQISMGYHVYLDALFQGHTRKYAFNTVTP